MDLPPADVIAAARREAVKMRAATADADAADRVQLEVAHFRKLGHLIELLCGLAESGGAGNEGAPDGGAGADERMDHGAKEWTMKQGKAVATSGTLGRIANDIIAAEAAYVEAERRREEAERECRLALDTLAQLRTDIDRALAEMQDRSQTAPAAEEPREPATARAAKGGSDDVLMLEVPEPSRAETDLIDPGR